MAKEFNVDIEFPHEDIQTITLNEAIRRFSLDEGDVELLRADKIVWLKGVAISKSSEDE